MARPTKKSLGIVHPEHQHYACRDCPARCCSSPWGIPVSPEERERILADDDAASRLNPRARAVLGAGVLPMRERDRKLVCVFLDDDLLCSLQKKHDHAFIPAPCQAYPFGFSENEHGQPVALLSRYCPSIRDDRGAPVGPLLAEKLVQAGGARPLSAKLGLRSGRVLGSEHFARVVEGWREILAKDTSVVAALARIYQVTDSFDEALQPRPPSSSDVEAALQSALRRPPPEVTPGPTVFNARVLFSYFLGGLSYPARVLLPHRNRALGFWERMRAHLDRVRWFLGRGSVDLYLVEGRVPLARVDRVSSPLSGPGGKLVCEYLREVLLRRQGMSTQTYLLRIVVDLGLMALLVSRHARAAAAAAGRTEPTEGEVREGIGIAELLFSHQSEAAHSTVLQSLRLKLMSDPADFRRLLASELSR